MRRDRVEGKRPICSRAAAEILADEGIPAPLLR